MLQAKRNGSGKREMNLGPEWTVIPREIKAAVWGLPRIVQSSRDDFYEPGVKLPFFTRALAKDRTQETNLESERILQGSP